MILEVDISFITRVPFIDIVCLSPDLLSNPVNWALHGCEKLGNENRRLLYEKFTCSDEITMEKIVGVRCKGFEKWD